MKHNNFIVISVSSLFVAPRRQPKSVSQSTYHKAIQESKDVLKLVHLLSSSVLSCRHDLAKVSSYKLHSCILDHSIYWIDVNFAGFDSVLIIRTSVQ